MLKGLLGTLRAQRRYFKEDRGVIAAENLITMQIAGSIGFVVSCIFFFIAPLIIPTWSITVEYKIVVPVLLLAFLFAFLYRRRKATPDPVVVEAACAVFYAALLAVFIAISVFPYPENPQIFVSLCFMFMPVLMIQRPALLLALMLCAEAVFVALAAQYKAELALQNDIFNTVAAMLFSCVMMITTNRLRCRDYNTRAKLELLSQTDALTGLTNKNAFEESCELYLQTRTAPYTLVVLDLDNFKDINDGYGHPFGDALLSTVGSVLLASFRQSDLVGRIGGDEFAVMLRGDVEPMVIEAKFEAIRRRLLEIEIDGVNPRLTCSAGASSTGADGVSYAELFKSADEALYEVKSHRRGEIRIRA